MELLSAEKDPVRAHLMSFAHYVLAKKLNEGALPIASFDVRFYTELIAELVKDVDFLKRVLNEEDLNRWW